MNRLLAEALAVFNVIGALVTIAACTAFGAWVMPIAILAYGAAAGLQVRQTPDQLQTQGVILGLFVGIVLAVMLHGFLALLIAMHNELKAIRELLQRQP